MNIYFYNTISRKKELFKPINKGFIGLYTCGPTVYDYAHIGNFRAYIFEDLLRRYLEFLKYDVLHVMNIRQSAKIIKINSRISSKNNQIQDNILRTGDKASVRFRFKVRGEFLKEGYKILLAEGRIKIVGQVKKIYT